MQLHEYSVNRATPPPALVAVLAPMSGGYINFDKDLPGDPRVVTLAEVYLDLIVETVEPFCAQPVDKQALRNALRNAARNATLGGLLALWVYADTHIRQANTLPLSVEKLADELHVPVALLPRLPAVWFKIDSPDRITLPDYIEKNRLEAREVRRDKNRRRQKRFRDRRKLNGGEANEPQVRRDTLNADRIRNAPVTPPRAGGRARASQSQTHTHTQTHTDVCVPARETTPVGDTEGFARIRAAYPRFTGRQDWLSAEHHCRLRIEQDEMTWDELLQAVERYAAFCAAGGVSGPRYVLTPGRFFSEPDKPWLQDWTPPPTKAETARDANISASAEWLAQQERKNAPK